MVQLIAPLERERAYPLADLRVALLLFHLRAALADPAVRGGAREDLARKAEALGVRGDAPAAVAQPSVVDVLEAARRQQGAPRQFATRSCYAVAAAAEELARGALSLHAERLLDERASWRRAAGGGTLLFVEERALLHYAEAGWLGWFDEGGQVRALFDLLLWEQASVFAVAVVQPL